ncbi:MULTISPECIES: hypothetical protein [Brevundimonas]|nr:MULTISPECIES: hypothetical protein [Brevundimonas]
MVVIALAVALVSGQDTSTPRSASDLTRDLNSGPPFATSAPTSAPVSAPAQVAPAPAPAPVRVEPAPQSRPAPQPSTLTRDLNSAPASTARPVTPGAQTPVAQTPAAQTPAAQRPAAQRPVTPPPAQTPVRSPSTAPVVQRPTAAPTPAPVQASPVRPAPAPPVGPQGLDAAAMAALPFTLDLPSGTVLTQSRAGADARIYAVRRGDTVLVMIYAGPASQFPIYDGQMIQAGGRASIVVTEGGRRLAIEHLFQRATAPLEIHVWVASPDGADREQGERIAQSVDAR